MALVVVDTSERFIKMISCPEIQDRWEPKVGDWIWRKYTVFGEELDNQIWGEDKAQEITVLVFKSSVEGYWHCSNAHGDQRIFYAPQEMHKATCLWIPRHDQLWDIMIECTKLEFWRLSAMLLAYQASELEFDDQGCHHWRHCCYDSIEQLMLSFVMHQLFDKQWDGARWVAIIGQ